VCSEPLIFLAMAYKKKQMFHEALSEGQRAATFFSNKTAILGCIGGCYASHGEKNEAMKVITQLGTLSKKGQSPAHRSLSEKR
jgi:hypothetical protein